MTGFERRTAAPPTAVSAKEMATDGPVLVVDRLSKVYEQHGKAAKEAIREVSFEVRAQELACVVGPSGAGKTTLLRCIAGLLEPTQGTALFCGRAVRAGQDDVAVVFQDYSRSLFPWLTVASNVALPLKRKDLTKAERSALVTQSLESVGLPDVASRHPWQLSGGMQQRVAIARALAYQPQVLLMDEPFASVDAQTRFELEDLLLRVREHYGMTIVFVTHDIDEAVYLGDRIVVLSESPCVVSRDLRIDLPAPRDQAATRGTQLFGTLRTEVLELVMQRGARP